MSKKRISSKWIFLSKWLFPVFWYGFLAFFLVTSFFSMSKRGEYDLVFLAFPIGMGIFGYFLFKGLVWDLVDEAWDCGDYLLFKDKDQELRVPLEEIVNISCSAMVNPPRMTVKLRKESIFGNEIVFSPVTKFTLNPFTKIAFLDELLERIDATRRG